MGLEIRSKVAGYYKLEAIKIGENGEEISRRIVADWFPNLITNQGLNLMGTSITYLNNCLVGSGSNTPTFTDTALQTFVAGTATLQTAEALSVLGSSPYYGSCTKTFQFAEGAAAGNITEVAVGTSITNANIFSRALILDGLGSPTTITILSDEILLVSYEFRFYPKLTDDVGTVVFTGNIGGTYDWIFRAKDVGTSLWQPVSVIRNMNDVSVAQVLAYNGDIGPITGHPAGSSSTLSKTVSAYVADSFESVYTVTASLTQGNLAGGIRSCTVILGLGDYQLQFDPAIPKTSLDSLSFVVKHSWGRF